MSTVDHLSPALANEALPRSLPIGTRLHDGAYEILGVVSESAYGINYCAHDHVHERAVVVKEYLPAAFATREPLSPDVNTSDSAAFHAGLRSFQHEARLLSTCAQPALIHVEACWREHDTAYMAMPLHEAPTLRQVIGVRGGPADEADVRAWLGPILDALDALHSAHCVHGDITPDSILIGETGPLLLGFGAGRHAVARALGTPADALKPGYAAPEQYEPEPSAAQGPWTDLYALAAVLRAAMIGSAPRAAPGPQRVERRARDRLPPLRELAGRRYSDELVDAIDATLARVPARRPQSVAEFRALLQTRPAHRGAVPAEALAASHAGHGATLIAAGAICLFAFGVLGVMALRHGETVASAPPPLVAAPTRTESPPAPVAYNTVLEAAPTAAGPVEPAALSSTTPSTAPPTPPLVAPPRQIAPTSPAFDPPPARARAAAGPPVTSPPAADSDSPHRAAPAPRARCTDLIQRGSLESLSPAEADKLKKECSP